MTMSPLAFACLFMMIPPANGDFPEALPLRVPIIPPVSAAVSPPLRPIDVLIPELSANDWQTRDEARRQLLDHGRPAIEALKAEFTRSSSYDVRRQIRLIVRSIFVFDKTESRGAFLGIQYQNAPGARIPQQPEGEQWTQVSSVVKGSAADRAGLKPGDLIRSLNGVPLTAENNIGDWIKKQPPHTQISLGVERNGKTLELKAVLGVRRTSDEEVALTRKSYEEVRRANSEFAPWWRQNFDPNGEMDESINSENDPNWTLQGGMRPLPPTDDAAPAAADRIAAPQHESR